MIAGHLAARYGCEGQGTRVSEIPVALCPSYKYATPNPLQRGAEKNE